MARSGRFPSDRAPRRRREGSAALEFALIAPVFFFMLFAVLEIAFVFVLDSLLANAAAESARLIRTGQASGLNLDEETFRERMCDRMRVLAPDCETRLSIDVREIPRFSNPDLPDPIEDGAFSDDELIYENGDARSIMIVRAWYRHPLLTPVLSEGLSRLSGQQAVLSATVAFRNEPWE